MRTTLGIVGLSILAAGCAAETETLDTELESIEDLKAIDRVAALGDGALVVGGRTEDAVVLVKMTTSGEIEDDWADGGVLGLDDVVPGGRVTDLLRLDDDSVLVTGASPGGGWIARVTADGHIDEAFAGGGLAIAESPVSLTIRSNQGLLIALDPGAGQTIGLALDEDGTPDPAIGGAGFLSAAQFTATDQYFAGRTAIHVLDPEEDQLAIGTVVDGEFWTAVFYLDGTPRFQVRPGTPFDPRSLVTVGDGFVVGGTSDGMMTAAKFNSNVGLDEQGYGAIGMARSSIASSEVATLPTEGGVALAGSTIDGAGEHPALISVLADGTIDGTLVDTATEAHVADAALLGDGSVVVVGSSDGQGFVGTYAMP